MYFLVEITGYFRETIHCPGVSIDPLLVMRPLQGAFLVS